MKTFDNYEIWFITGSQHLYGPETLKMVDEDSSAIVEGLNASNKLPVKLVLNRLLKHQRRY